MNKKNKKIFMVEDEAIIAMSQKKTLEDFGYEVSIAKSGEEAIQIVNNDCNCDLILMDINLGSEMDGTQAAKKILESKDIPIVFNSSHQEKEVVEKTEKITSYGYVVKGSSPTVLDASIKMAFRLHESKKKEQLAYQRLDKTSASLPGAIYQYKIRDNSTGYFPFITKKVEELFEISPQELRNSDKPFKDIIHPDYAQKVYETNKESFENLIFWECDFKVILPKSKIEKWVSAMANPEKVKDGVLWHGYIWDATDRKKKEDELNMKSLVLDQIQDRVTLTDLDGNITYVNNAELKAMKTTKEEMIGKSVLDINVPEGMVTQEEVVQKTLQNGMYQGELASIDSEGNVVYSEIRTRIIHDENNNPIALVGVENDIAEAKAEKIIAEKEKEMAEKNLDKNRIILREAHHRMKNSFASIESMIHLEMQKAECQEAHDVLLDVLGRVKSMRIVYDKIIETQDFNTISVRNYFQSFLEAIISVFQNGSNIEIEKDIDDIELSSKAMFPLGVIVNEFITNSMKYAFTKGEEGKISLTINKSNGNGNSKKFITIHIADNGKGIPEESIGNPEAGFGTVLIYSMCEQLNSEYEIYNDNGANLKLKFKITD